MRIAGLLLAAGAGRRFGGPKALAHGGAWLRGGVAALAGGGCAPVFVVLGADADAARTLVPENATVVVAEGWAEGMAASLRAGLAALPEADAVVVHLVDLPDVTAEVVARIIGHGETGLARATYGGRPGHPVLIARRHWPEIIETVHGDEGARGWLAARDDVVKVECSDLAVGSDVDRR